MTTKDARKCETTPDAPAIAHARPDFRPWEQYVTCCHCAHPLDDNPRMKDALKSHTTAVWAKGQLAILGEMAADHHLPDWYIKEVRRIAAGIAVMPNHFSGGER